jgi:pSer/pThr/pTyr-binding forkhead associated (FHA) protein
MKMKLCPINHYYDSAEYAFCPFCGSNSFVLGVSGQHAGKSLSVGGGLVFGRDPKRCNVVFDADTRGISALHCRITRTETGLRLTDCSTYGTFLNNERIAPHLPVQLQAGDCFFLADVNEGFVVG